jgi:hypothetical protein
MSMTPGELGQLAGRAEARERERGDVVAELERRKHEIDERREHEIEQLERAYQRERYEIDRRHARALEDMMHEGIDNE